MVHYKDLEKRKQYMKNYYIKNKEHLKQLGKDWRKKHKSENLKRIKKWREQNKEQTKINNAKSAYKRIRETRIEILNLLGNKCSICGYSDPRALQIDHVNGGGRKELRKFSNYFIHLKFVLTQIKAGSKDYQLLCANHNAIKRYENERPISRFES
jgi:hypothetical protein